MHAAIFIKCPLPRRVRGDWRMIGYLVLGLTLGLPLILGLAFRVGAPHLFFSLMAGELLARYFGSNAEHTIDSLSQRSDLAAYGEALIVVLPMVLTAFILRGSLSKRKTALHVIPLAITGVVLAAFILPLLPVAIQEEIRAIELGSYLLNLQGVIIGTVVALQLVALWVLNRKNGKDPT